MRSKTLDYFDVDVEREDMDILKRGGLFTDTIVTAYFKYIENVVHASKKIDERILFMEAVATSYAVREDDTEDFNDIFEDFLIHKKELIFFPMNDSKGMVPQSGSHWSLLVFDRNTKGYFRHFDSARSGSNNMFNVNRLVKKLFPLLKTDCNEFHVVQEKTPQQKNGLDCGPYICRIAERVSQQLEPLREAIDFEPMMPELRRLLYNDILNRATKA